MKKRQLIYESFSEPSEHDTYFIDSSRNIIYSDFSVDGFDYTIKVAFIKTEDDSNYLGLTYTLLVALESFGKKYKLTKNNHPFKLASNIVWLLENIMKYYSYYQTIGNLKSHIVIKSIDYYPLFLWGKELLNALKFNIKSSLSLSTESDYKEAINKRDKFFRYCIEKYAQDKGVRVKFEKSKQYNNHVSAIFVPGLKI